MISKSSEILHESEKPKLWEAVELIIVSNNI